jgi:hypothetical protein
VRDAGAPWEYIGTMSCLSLILFINLRRNGGMVILWKCLQLLLGKYGNKEITRSSGESILLSMLGGLNSQPL